MRKMVQSLRRDHRDIEQILRVLEQECDVFCRAERPDYELVGEIIEYLGSFLDQYHHPKEDVLFKIARKLNATCARVIDGIAAERAGAISSLQALGETLREILNEQRVQRQTFEDAARAFILHERRQIEMEERSLFPIAQSAFVPAERVVLHAKLRDENMSLRTRQLKGRLRDKRRWIIREEVANQADRKVAPPASNR